MESKEAAKIRRILSGEPQMFPVATEEAIARRVATLPSKALQLQEAPEELRLDRLGRMAIDGLKSSRER